MLHFSGPRVCVSVGLFVLLQLVLPAKQAAYLDKFGEEMPTPQSS